MASFDTAAADFIRFAVSQGYPPNPPNLLWVKPRDVVLAFRKGSWTYFVWNGDATERKNLARAEYESTVNLNIGIAIEGRCKTDRWTICRVYVPVDGDDAAYRMIPQTGVKHSVVDDPLPAVLVESKIWWWFLKLMTRKESSAWD